MLYNTQPLPQNAATAATSPIWQILGGINDPEIPVLSILDLGIVRAVDIDQNGVPLITITPTYSGCPAMDMIAMNIKLGLSTQGYPGAEVRLVWSPAWTTDWITEEAKLKLKAYGIAPPIGSAAKAALVGPEREIPCPHCNSLHTELISLFGSTACKSYHRCNDCWEPFEYFKCH
jgi:ring-1,2-phenylacetyl-CoA epoxidase subunit PaaD